MPSNTISINNAIEYNVSDSKMDELIEWLDENGSIIKDDENERSDAM